MGYQFVKTKIEGETGVLTLDHAPVNALSPKMLEEISAALDEFGENAAIRAVVITGAGTNAFCAGADVNELAKLKPEESSRVVELGHKVFSKIENFKLPVLCAVNNLCLGGGLELALACDLRIASDRARLGFPEVTLGLIPAWGGTQRLTRVAGAGKAKELIFTAQLVNAPQALQAGIVNMVVPDGDELRAALDIAKRMSIKCAPLAVQAAKVAINRGADRPIEEGLKIELDQAAVVSRSQDLAEGIRAFVEKRQPKFQGK
ncbi:MAG: enoyl-CoA hydratase/isomerase family protein [Methanobacteriota archaeon]